MTHNPHALTPSKVESSTANSPKQSSIKGRGMKAPIFTLYLISRTAPAATWVGAFHSADAALQFAPIWLADEINAMNQDRYDAIIASDFVVNEAGVVKSNAVECVPAVKFLAIGTGIAHAMTATSTYRFERDKHLALAKSLNSSEQAIPGSHREDVLATSRNNERTAMRAMNSAFHDAMKIGTAEWNKPDAGAAERASFIAAYNLPEEFAGRYR